MTNIPPPPPPMPPGGPIYGAAGPPRTDGQAIAALVLGVIPGVFCIVTPILAIVFGAIARGRIDHSNGQLSGRGMATAGLVLGIVWIVLGAVWILLLVAARD